MKIYECLKGFSIEECDGDGFTLENQYVDINKGSKWKCDTENNFRLIDGEVRLISLSEEDCTWLELTKEHLQEYFKEIVNTDGYEKEYVGLTIEGKQILVGSLLKDDENFEWIVMPKNENGQYELLCHDLMVFEPVYPRILKCKVIA